MKIFGKRINTPQNRLSKKKPTKKELKETYGIEIADDEEKKEGDEDKESKAEEKKEEKPETPKTT